MTVVCKPKSRWAKVYRHPDSFYLFAVDSVSNNRERVEGPLAGDDHAGGTFTSGENVKT
jgi:hypothetical protein